MDQVGRDREGGKRYNRDTEHAGECANYVTEEYGPGRAKPHAVLPTRPLGMGIRGHRW